VFEIIEAGGWVMWPILLCSIIAMGIIAERFWALQPKKILPRHLVKWVWNWAKNEQLSIQNIRKLKSSSILGEVLAAGLVNHQHGRDVMKESIEEVGRQVAVKLERFLNTLGTIAAITPLLGLLGTVIGMIEVFTVITSEGVGNAEGLAGGISQALITTATGLSVAIPALIFHRFFERRVEELIVGLEQEALKMVEILHGEREDIKGEVDAF
jgi:biopolymer transport protein ExbB